MHVNKLIHESSPYLLQHAHNPVEWYPWGDEALQLAKQNDKPILVSIGYAACHWCHVMERESFEDEATAKIMNEHFINIKIDREERPDLDHLYMDAVQAMTGSGGWPLNVFLTPDLKPFYGGTYFPPIRAFNRNSWTEVLTGISKAYKERRFEIEEQANNLTQHLQKANSFGFKFKPNDTIKDEQIHVIAENILKSADTIQGGFGKAPKFPQTFSIQYLLRYYYKTKDEKALQQACLSLDKMIAGGIYDQLGGGFARYSTDDEWLAPHFEKMLYDNALLVSVLSEAYQLTRNQKYLKTIHHTMEFVMTEMMNSEFGFYAALDADSEGEEGKYYVWSKAEIENLLYDDASLFMDYYNVSQQGNWEGKNILRCLKSKKEFCEEHEINPEDFEIKMAELNKIILFERRKRIRPLLDDKIILSWNALMNTACSKAFAATGDEVYRRLAIKNMRFLLNNFEASDGSFYHTYKNGIAKFPAFLDDYAFLAEALIHLQEITSNTEYLVKSKEITEYVLKNFASEDDDLFFYTTKNQSDILVRKKEIYDSAVPSGNSVFTSNLLYLSVVFDKPDWKQKAMNNLYMLEAAIIRYPVSFGIWSKCLLSEVSGVNEIAIIGKDFKAKRDLFLSQYFPFRILQTSFSSNESFPLLAQKLPDEKTLIYCCKNYSCQLPFEEVNEIF